MTRVVKFEKMVCDRCKKVLDSVTNKGERFYILTVDTWDTKIGVALDSEEDADQARATSGIESDLCSSCYETVMGILSEELRNDQLR
jgi:uncharacterized protein YqfA (UPF0365 family)